MVLAAAWAGAAVEAADVPVPADPGVLEVEAVVPAQTYGCG